MVRSDLPIGMIGAQLIHAAGESSPGSIGEGTFAIALAARDEQDLLRIADHLRRSCIEHTPICEPDAPYHGQLMAIGIAPKRRSKLRPFLSSIPLLKEICAGVAQR